jgi:hypothetical protein
LINSIKDDKNVEFWNVAKRHLLSYLY